MTKIRYCLNLILLPLLVLLAACGDDAPKPPAEVGRTVLVYMIASNNLGTGGYDQMDLQEMKTAAMNGDINNGRLLVYHVTKSGMPVLKEVTAAGIDTLKVYDNLIPSVDSRRMREVFNDMRQLAPARDYGLVLWSHASGWLQDGVEDELDGQLSPKAFGVDNGQKMNITTLARTLEGQSFSFVYFDCCYMGAVEVAYELQNATPLIVASPSEIPSRGMPYEQNVRCFFTNPPDMVGAARNTFQYYNAKTGMERTCTMSVIDTRNIGRLAELTRQIYQSATSSWPVGYSPQRYMLESRCYHFDLAHYVLSLTDDPDLQGQWKNALNECVKYEDATPMLWNSQPLDAHCGLSTYIFTNEQQSEIKNYNSTSWYRDVASALIK